eukprot:7116748-Prymnesium_polylepis.1
MGMRSRSPVSRTRSKSPTDANMPHTRMTVRPRETTARETRLHLAAPVRGPRTHATHTPHTEPHTAHTATCAHVHTPLRAEGERETITLRERETFTASHAPTVRARSNNDNKMCRAPPRSCRGHAPAPPRSHRAARQETTESAHFCRAHTLTEKALLPSPLSTRRRP